MPSACNLECTRGQGRLRAVSGATRSLEHRGGESDGRIELEVGDRVVKISNPDRVYFSAAGETKLDLASYYLSVADGIVNALYHRPCMLHRFPDGVDGEKVHQKRLPQGAPEWIETVRVHFPRYKRYADELCVTHPADVIWAVQMSTVEFHPWNSRRDDTEKPDEWRIDLDPMPEATYDVRHRVQVEIRHSVGGLGVLHAAGIGVDFHGGHLHRPRHGGVADARLVGARWGSDGAGTAPAPSRSTGVPPGAPLLRCTFCPSTPSGNRCSMHGRW